MRFVSPLLLGLAAVGFAGCAANSAKPVTTLDTILQSTLAQPLVEDSVMREGDNLSFQLVVPKTDTVLHPTVQFEAACSSPGLYLLYLDGAGRVYPGGPRLYSAARELSAQLHSTLAANPTFIQACARIAVPDWRVIKTDERDNWVMIDRNSIQKREGETRFWAAFDQPAVLNDMPYNAPYAQKREHLSVSCATSSFKLLAGYDLDAHNRVSDGKVQGPSATQTVASSNADYQALFAQVCGAPEKIAQLAPFKPRHKVPLTVGMQPVDPSVLKSIGELGMAQPGQTIKYLRSQGTSNFQGKPGKAGEELFIGADAASGQLSIVARGQSYEDHSISWRGLIALVSKSEFSSGSGMSESTLTSQLSFTGDWKNMPVGQSISYTKTSTTLNSIVGAYNGKPKTTTCKIERELNASELNPGLTGRAKALSCSGIADEYGRTTHDFYLTDYGYFFHASTDKNRFFYDDYRIEAVE